MSGTSTNPAEIARFDRLAKDWWSPAGPMRPLHRMNALRVAWIADRIGRQWPEKRGQTILDVGCGAGLASEALARRGFSVLGVDPSAHLITAAVDHAEGQGLPLRYRVALPEALAAERAQFDVITALEVIEHVPQPATFLATLSSVVSPGGLLFLSTLNRTLKSLLVAKLGAEYVLRLLPPGTHDWQRFVPPAEMDRWLARAGFRLADIAGMTFDPLHGAWRESRDLSVNYILMAAA